MALFLPAFEPILVAMSRDLIPDEKLDQLPPNPVANTRNDVHDALWTVKWYVFGPELKPREFWVVQWTGTLDQVEAAALVTARKRPIIGAAIWQGNNTLSEPILVFDKRTFKAQRERPLPVKGLAN